jgi:hypothetical protein
MATSTGNTTTGLTTAGPIITGSCSTAIGSQNYVLTTNVVWEEIFIKPKCFKLGDTKVCVYNDKNYKLLCDKIQFNLVLDDCKTDLEVTKIGLLRFNTIDELRTYLNKLKKYYKQTLEYVKKLNIQEDF